MCTHTHIYTHVCDDVEFYFFNNLFIFVCPGSSLLHGFFTSCREQGLLSSCGLQWLLLLQSTGFRVSRLQWWLSSCSSQARMQAQSCGAGV